MGHQVVTSDLYKMKFNPVGSKDDFIKLSSNDYYKYPVEQLHAAQNKLFEPKLQIEIDKLLNAQFILFNFPLWWFSMPAILKGWVDRVMAYGVAYGKGTEDIFADKKALVTITTGSPYDINENPSVKDILKNVEDGILGYVGYNMLESFIAYGVSRISNDDRKKILLDYESFLINSILPHH